MEILYDVVIIAVEPEELYRNIRDELRELGVEKLVEFMRAFEQKHV